MAISLDHLLGRPDAPFIDPAALGYGRPEVHPLPEPEPIAVEGNPIRSGYREGLLGGAFGVGRTGGNILGILGDALLMNEGLDPIYQQRLQRARASEALADYRQEPGRAIDAYAQIDPQGAATLADKQREIALDTQTTQSNLEKAAREREDYINNLGAGYLSTVTDQQSYDRVLGILDNLYDRAGLENPYRRILPENYNEAAIQAGLGFPLQAKDRANLEITRTDKEARRIQDAKEEFGRNWREAFGETMATTRAIRQEQGRDRRARMKQDGGISRPQINVFEDESGEIRLTR